MELQELYGLMDRFAASGLTALEWERGEEKISLRREGTASSTVAAPAPVPVSSVPEEQEEGEVVTAPLVGVFYAAPAPEEPPYVTAGAQVKKGDTLWALAQRYGLSLHQLVALNPQIKNPNLIQIGEEVRVR